MPLSYEISEAEKLIRIHATGPVNSDDLPPMSATLAEDPGIRPGMRFLVEASDVAPHLSFTDLRNAAQLLSTLRKKGVRKMAIVADTAHIFALAKVYAVFAPPAAVDVEVVRDLASAMRWLEARPGSRTI